MAIQITHDADELSKYLDLNVLAVFGGMDYEKQRRQLEGKIIDIVVGTPGRLLDFNKRRDLNLSKVEVLVIDEADRMLDMGFIPDVRTIVRATPRNEDRQTMLYSATLTADVLKLAGQWMTDAEEVNIAPKQVAVDTVDQKIFIVTTEEKIPLLYHLLKTEEPERTIIFTNRRDAAEKLSRKLYEQGFDCDLLSGAVAQNKRIKILEKFRAGDVKILVATDVAGRGLHINNVSHIFNYNIPLDPEDYVHRIGRTGRAGKSGQSITFACEAESFHIPPIEEYIGRDLPCTHPEDEWLEPLPEPVRKAPPIKRAAGDRPRGNRSGGNRSGGNRRGGPSRGRSGGGNRGGSNSRGGSRRSSSS